MQLIVNWMQDVNDAVEQFMSQAISAVPRTGRELERIHNSASSLKGDLQTVEHRLLKIEEGTHESIGEELCLIATASHKKQATIPCTSF